MGTVDAAGSVGGAFAEVCDSMVLGVFSSARHWFGLSQAIAQPMNILPARALLYLSAMNISAYRFCIRNSLLFRATERSLFRLLRDERGTVEQLLLNILPKDIVAILRDRRQTIADHFDGATILFADVVNFTPLAAKLTPKQTVELLNQVFSFSTPWSTNMASRKSKPSATATWWQAAYRGLGRTMLRCWLAWLGNARFRRSPRV
jgi:hypothetical protein